MTLPQWELEFDILFNNISSNQAPGLNPLEKSICLSQAQEIVFKELYDGASGGGSFERTEEVTEYLRTHVVQQEYHSSDEVQEGSKICSNSHLFDIPDDLWFITYESAVLEGANCSTINTIVTPVTQDDFYKTYNDPFRGPDKRKVLRLLHSDKIELVSKGNIDTYTVRYLKRLEPIVLEGCANTLEPYSNYPDGHNCELPESMHRTILIKAVQIAKSIWA